MKTLIASSLVIFASSLNPSASASVKWGPASGTEIKGVALSSNLEVGGIAKPLDRVAQGLRQKKVVFAWFNVYVAQFFSSQAADKKSVEGLRTSLLKGMPTVVTMTFLRDVEIGKIADGFKDSLKENGIDAEASPFKEFISAIVQSGDVKEHQRFAFIFNADKAGEAFRVETRDKEIFALQNQAGGTAGKFMSLWLGKPVDAGLRQLQEQVLKP